LLFPSFGKPYAMDFVSCSHLDHGIHGQAGLAEFHYSD